ncbi:1-acylglycerol-3-phosphate O-acyltransferase [Glaciecola sp. MH2013]|uniref:1-acylglycerol-3-phosphate O-acyltransferase n=1 Tax=Glaciecola sp. MH2013 TaxID=2785524 RepID=UPI00189F8AB4|nr:1-acylglycerol-3-phosphate O-acyltransferase [Glaciecola sp. MH2013]MBF7074946.1 1-acylglycerol-3-phosphate O-acyltransferase [Glaciecola sp. MH2013]
MLAIIRFIALLAYFIGVNAVLFVIFLFRPFHRNNVNLCGKMYATMATIVGLKIELRVSKQIDPNKNYIFIANHQNSYDLITICKAALPGVVTVGKKSLKWIPIFGVIYWLSANIMIDRKNTGRARDTLTATLEKMRANKLSIWFFPEGTRSYGRGLLPFKTGAFRLALAAKEAIVPVCASELHNKVKLNRWNNGTVVIEALAPIEMPEGMSAKELSVYYHEIMAKKIAELNIEAQNIDGQHRSV